MTLFIPCRRATLHIPETGPPDDPSRGHLHIILTDISKDKTNLVVPICSHYDKCDQTCVLDSGHKFIKHKSFVLYAKADVVSSDILHRAVKEGIISFEGLFGEKEFETVCAGVTRSRHIRPAIKIYYNQILAK